jgi:hypothetical protein
MLLCPVALRSGTGVVADHGPIYVSVRGGGKAVDNRFSRTGRLANARAGAPQLYCYFDSLSTDDGPVNCWGYVSWPPGIGYVS